MLKGKQFEKSFQDAFKDSNYEFTRLYDTTSGFKGSSNPCDFIMPSEAGTLYLEMKVTQEAALNKSALTDNQFTRLIEIEGSPHAHGLIVVYFERYEVVACISALDFHLLMQESGKKSVNYKQYASYFKTIPHTKKRVNIVLDCEEVVKAMVRYCHLLGV